jgi:rare lipoprotein A
MGFHPLIPQNWNRMFTVWIEDVQVRFKPVAKVAMDGGMLRRIRAATRVSAAVVILFFSLHCTKPPVAAKKPAKTATENQDDFGQGYMELGVATWYGGNDGFEGKHTASGELMDSSKLSCAHRTLPLGSFVEVRNLDNGRQAILRVNDRGPFLKGRILDVSRQGAKALGFLEAGKANVKIRVVKQDGSPSDYGQAVDLTNPYTIQVAALADPENIARLTKDLEAAIGPVTAQSFTTTDGRVVQRLRVGAYTSMEEAQKAAELVSQRFGARGVEPFITRRY